jgi:hypothetical protein
VDRKRRMRKRKRKKGRSAYKKEMISGERGLKKEAGGGTGRL